LGVLGRSTPDVILYGCATQWSCTAHSCVDSTTATVTQTIDKKKRPKKRVRGAWIGAGATLIAAVVGVLFARTQQSVNLLPFLPNGAATTITATVTTTVTTIPPTSQPPGTTDTTDEAVPEGFRVPLSTLCGESTASAPYCPLDSNSNQVQVGKRLFEYIAQSEGGSAPTCGRLFTLDESTCTKLVIHFTEGDEAEQGSIATGEIVQTTGTDYAHAGRNTIGVLKATLNGGPLKVAFNTTDGYRVRANGYAMCTTQSGN
jgi:hypothetical protein